jgi:hypothetical protein
MSQAALIGGGILLAMISLIIFGIIFYMNVMGKKKTTPTSNPTPSSNSNSNSNSNPTPSSNSNSTSNPTPSSNSTPALPPPPPPPSSYFNETCADLGGGSDIISARDLNDCMDLCRTNGHGYPYSCKGFIYGSSYDGYSPFCRIYNNKDLDHGTQICGMGLKTYTLK